MKVPNNVRRVVYVVTAVSLSFACFLTNVPHVSANQVTTRYIKLSKSVLSATNVAAKVSFVAPNVTAGNIQGIVIDFCSNNPIIGDSCTAPTGFNVNRSTTSLNNQTGISGFAVYTSDATNNRIIINNASGGAIAAGTTISFELGNDTSNGFTNPNSTGSFYARIYTYATSAAAIAHSTNTPTGYVDYGGIALSTAAIVNITARVMETLSFCVYDATCGDDPSFTIGHAVGTTTVIDNTLVDTETVNFSISTNANGGAAVRLKGDTLKSGANDIDAAGTAAIAFSAGTEKFGMRLSTSGTNITAVSPYNSATDYAFDVTSAAGDNSANVTSTYGGRFATLSGPVSNSVSTITFAATASNTTPAGTYTAAEQLIATGTF